MDQSPCPTCGLLAEHPRLTETPLSLRFSELLSANTPPLDVEVHGLRQIMQESSVYIDSLHSQITKAQETLSALMGLQETALCRMADAKSILHPMRSLPEDVLTEIFLCCTPIVNHHEIDWSTDGDKFDSLSPLNHPWNISHVSHRWRDITLSLPRLWSMVYLDFTRYTSFSPQQCSLVGSLFFERSANLDLCVNIASGEMNIGAHPLMPLLKKSAKRWRILNSHMSSSSLQSFSGCQFHYCRSWVYATRIRAIMAISLWTLSEISERQNHAFIPLIGD
ncbi:hypothetical protein CPB85DRAFT_543467 [Mucidula mucida]|nr:hypothetical protein CPB85DRAFT_543467 [Mucidula mucida]